MEIRVAELRVRYGFAKKGRRGRRPRRPVLRRKLRGDIKESLRDEFGGRPPLTGTLVALEFATGNPYGSAQAAPPPNPLFPSNKSRSRLEGPRCRRGRRPRRPVSNDDLRGWGSPHPPQAVPLPQRGKVGTRPIPCRAGAYVNPRCSPVRNGEPLCSRRQKPQSTLGGWRGLGGG